MRIKYVKTVKRSLTNYIHHIRKGMIFKTEHKNTNPREGVYIECIFTLDTHKKCEKDGEE